MCMCVSVIEKCRHLRKVREERVQQRDRKRASPDRISRQNFITCLLKEFTSKGGNVEQFTNKTQYIKS